MPTPQARQIHAPKAVTKNKKMDKVDDEDDGLAMDCSAYGTDGEN